MLNRYQRINHQIFRFQVRNFSQKFDSIIIGTGHNGLVCANYLGKEKKSVLMLEARPKIGGAANSEEVFEGYTFSRCSYVLSLFRKKIIQELFTEEKFYSTLKLHEKHNFCPSEKEGEYLYLDKDSAKNKQRIAKYSKNDAENYDKFFDDLNKLKYIIDPLIDIPPLKYTLREKIGLLAKTLKHSKKDLSNFYSILTSPAQKLLDRHFENDLIKGFIASDSVIGAYHSPKSLGSGYVLLHHVFSQFKNQSWYFVEGGMGSVSKLLEDTAIENGVKISVNSPVNSIIVENNRAVGVRYTENGEEKEAYAKVIISNCTDKITYNLLPNEKYLNIEREQRADIEGIDYRSPSFKLNLVVDKLPKFTCIKNLPIKEQKKILCSTIHVNSNSIEEIDQAYKDSMTHDFSKKPFIEMTIPSVVDETLVKNGKDHYVVGIFAQYVNPESDWNEDLKRKFADAVYNEIDRMAPGFKDSIIHEDLLSPLDLEREFNLTGGNIFHGALSIDSLFINRPFNNSQTYYGAVDGLMHCGSSRHPGGGVMGAPGRNCAIEALKEVL